MQAVAESDSFAVAMGENREMNIGAISAASLAGRVTTANAVVTLTQGGTVVATAQTDADGYFELTSLRPGAYRVRIALPEHTLFALGTALELPSEGRAGRPDKRNQPLHGRTCRA